MIGNDNPLAWIAGLKRGRWARGMLLLPALTFLPAGALAQCSFDALTKTRPMVLSFVRNYAACTAPDTTYGSGYYDLRGCTSISPAEPTIYRFAPNGGCTIKVKSSIVEDCSTVEGYYGNLPAGPCQVTSFRGKCSGIERDGLPILSADVGWVLRASLRITTESAVVGDLTVEDSPFRGLPPEIPDLHSILKLELLFGNPRDGSISIDRTIVDASVWSQFWNNAEAFAPCTSTQILSLEVVDPAGLSFAVPGFSTRPAAN